jgi:hypothetical protein
MACLVYLLDEGLREGRGCCGDDCDEGEKGQEGDEAIEGGCHSSLELRVVGSIFPVSVGTKATPDPS